MTNPYGLPDDFEQDRVDMFRTFRVTLTNGMKYDIFAHQWAAHDGMCMFTTTEASTRQSIRNSFAIHSVLSITEITSEKTLDHINAIHARIVNEEKRRAGFETDLAMKQPFPKDVN